MLTVKAIDGTFGCQRMLPLYNPQITKDAAVKQQNTFKVISRTFHPKLLSLYHIIEKHVYMFITMRR